LRVNIINTYKKRTYKVKNRLGDIPGIIARLVSSKLNFASSPEIILKIKTNAFILVKEISKRFSPKHKMDAD